MGERVVQGDFSLLAEDYARYRPGYAEPVVDAVLGLSGRSPAALDVADVGSGTGIWTRQLARRRPRTVVAVEPNGAMRERGSSMTEGVRWLEGSGEATGLAAESVDLLCMASSFHWVDLDKGLREFARVLRPGGWFVALWNPRDLSASPLAAAAEAELTRRAPRMLRVSSGRSPHVEERMRDAERSPSFDACIYLEGRHRESLSPDAYVGLWRSVNDVRAQLGSIAFDEFLEWVRDSVRGLPAVETVYRTRAWALRRVVA
jgi:ubiquinone/menaquinone biosynthesis C-methylase UbiE